MDLILMLNVFQTGMETPSFFAALVAGLILFFSPCIAPVIPAYLSSISGVSWKEMNKPGINWKVMANAGWFVGGFSLLFILMGLLLGYFSTIPGFRTWVNYIGGTLILVLALHMLELINIPFLNREFNVSGRVKPRGYLGSAMMGGAFGLAWTPCTGPVLATILAFAANTGEVVQSGWLMFGFSMGLAIPFLATGLFTSRVTQWLSRQRHFMKWLNRVTGVILIVLGVLIFTGRLDALLGRLFNWLGISI